MPIIVSTIIEKLKPFTAVTFPTLGGHSRFNVIIGDDGIVTLINSGNNLCVLNDHHIEAVNNRYQELQTLGNGIHLHTVEYNAPNWNAPNHIFSPYVARIIHYIYTNQ